MMVGRFCGGGGGRIFGGERRCLSTDMKKKKRCSWLHRGVVGGLNCAEI